MGLTAKISCEVKIKSDGDVFHEIYRERPHHISSMSPGNIQACHLHDGEWGNVGAITFWKYIHDGKEREAKAKIEAIDEAKKLVSYRVVEGDLMELYKSFTVSVHVETEGEMNLVAWTLEYEKLREDVPDPNTLLDFCVNVTNDIEAHHLPPSS